ncbi:MAG: nucleotidyltransferase family protein [Gammaproteobacteria bacterium]|nr:nucleotidyltransferase family protein [Gammaproteobacteria bacterium]
MEVIMTDILKSRHSASSTMHRSNINEVAVAHRMTDIYEAAVTYRVTPGEAVQVFVLAGERVGGDPLALSEGVISKAVIDIVGQPMLSRVLRSLGASRANLPAHVIGLMGDALERATDGIACHFIEAQGKGPAASLLKALEEGGVALPLLVTTGDHALLTPEMIDTFLEKSAASDADVTIGLAERVIIEAAYPQTRRTYLPLGGVELSGCDMYYLATPKALSVVRFWQRAERDRKKPWRLAWHFGPLTALRILLARSGPEAVFGMLSRRLGVRVRPIIMAFAEAAIDVDKTDDLALVREIIANRAK